MSVYYILDNSLDILYVVTEPSGNVVESNELFKGFTSHFKPRKFQDILEDGSDIDAVLQAVKKANEHEPECIRFYSKTKQKSGASRWIMWNVYSINKSLHFIGVNLYDVTSITNHEYERQQILLEEFRFMLSHELRQPLTSVSSLISLLLNKDSVEDTEKEKMLKMIGESVDRLDQSIKALVRKAAREL
jgi:nitrogen-specific signal transduction histidine kinase